MSNCQSTDLDAHIASVSIVFMNYMILAVRKRFDDYESLGGIFESIKEQLLEDILIVVIWNIFNEIYFSLFAPLSVDWEIFLEKLIDNKENIIEIISNNLSSYISSKNKAA